QVCGIFQNNAGLHELKVFVRIEGIDPNSSLSVTEQLRNTIRKAAQFLADGQVLNVWSAARVCLNSSVPSMRVQCMQSLFRHCQKRRKTFCPCSQRARKVKKSNTLSPSAPKPCRIISITSIRSCELKTALKLS